MSDLIAQNLTPTDGVGENQPVEGGQVEDVSSVSSGEPASEEPMIEIDGQKYPLSEVKRWRDTRPNLQKYYYTKLNELAAKEKQLQEAVTLYEFLRQRPDVSKRLLEFVQGGGDPSELERQPGETQDEYLARLERIEKQVTDMYRKFEEQERIRLQREADETLVREIARLKEKYGNDKILPFNEEQVLLEAYNSGIYDLERVYKQLRGEALDLEKLKQMAIQEYINQKKTTATPKTPSTSGGIPTFGATAPKTFLEAKRAALQRLLGRREGE